MPELKENRLRYETKCIAYQQDAFKYPMILTKFNGNGHPVLSGAGYRGDYILCANVDGGVVYAGTDLYEFTRRMLGIDNENLFRFLSLVENGEVPFDEIEDGETYTEGQIKQITNESES